MAEQVTERARRQRQNAQMSHGEKQVNAIQPGTLPMLTDCPNTGPRVNCHSVYLFLLTVPATAFLVFLSTFMPEGVALPKFYDRDI